jgi:hypothetical protein
MYGALNYPFLTHTVCCSFILKENSNAWDRLQTTQSLTPTDFVFILAEISHQFINHKVDTKLPHYLPYKC